MARNISLPPPPVKTAEKLAQEQRATERKYRAALRENRKQEQIKPLQQSLGSLLRAAGL
jgi:hypothetical protein